MSLNHRLAEDDPNRNSIQWRAEIGLLPSFLNVNEIAELWAKGTKFAEESYVKVLKKAIEDSEFACMTKGQWITLSEERRKRLSHKRPPPVSGNDIFFGFELVSHGTTGTDLEPEDRIGGYLGDTSAMSVQEKEMATRLYMVNRTEFKKWLQKNEKWPLPEECLLARWWDSAEGNEEADAVQANATKQQEKAIQVLIKRVLQANPEASIAEIWNNLKKYDDIDDIKKMIYEQEPDYIETITGHKEAYIICYTNHKKRGKEPLYRKIKLKAFQTRCTQAKKELD